MPISDYHVVGDANNARPVPPTPASSIGYDNTSSGISATDVQGAIDEIASGGGGGSAVQSDWTQTDPNADDYIKNKPTLGTASAKNFTTSVTQNSNDLVTSGAVFTAIDNLPKPMIFKGTLGTNGTITILPSASTLNEGYTYKVITAGTYASQSAKVGDVFTSNGSEWVRIPSGDETDTDTWRNIKLNGSEVLGNGISSGGLDFINGTGLNAVFNSTGNKLQFNVDTDNLAPAFTEASTRANISTGEKLSILFGKIKKFFSDLKTVAFSGSYNDLTDKPTIPTVNNGTLTIQKNGTDVQTFTANQSTSATANITVPTKTSDLTNDSGFITSDSDEKVKQTNTTTNADYRVLFSENANNTTQTVGARKNKDFLYNPSTGNLQVKKLNGVTIGNSPEFTDTTTGTIYTASRVPHNTTFATNGSVKNAYDALNSNLGGLVFSTLEIGPMPSTVSGERKTALPTGFASTNTFVVAVRILRGGGQYIYTDVSGGLFCAIYLNGDNTVSLVATADGVTYCAGQSVSVILARV